jgi:superfamily II DNA or RNA helicase
VKDERTKLSYQRKQWTDKQIKNFLPDFDYTDHQVKALKSMLKTNIGIIKAVTSAGKTEIFIAFIKATRFPTLILVNRVNLALQIRKRIQDNGFKNVGICYGGSVKEGDIMVSTIGSVKKLPNPAKYKILILDEVHRSQSSQFQEFLEQTSYPIRFGFSATPDSGDKYKYALIRQFVGSVICEIKAQELIENKVIVKPKIIFIPIKCQPTIDWPSANYKNIVWNKKRNDKIRDIVLANPVPTLILVHQINHGENLVEDLPDSVFVSGMDDVDVRRNIIKDFENGNVKTIISTNIFNEGISINAIRQLIIAGGGKSKIETVQRLGRGLRLDPKTGKNECLVYDFYDDGNRFTLKHSEQRKKIYKKLDLK